MRIVHREKTNQQVGGFQAAFYVGDKVGNKDGGRLRSKSDKDVMASDEEKNLIEQFVQEVQITAGSAVVDRFLGGGAFAKTYQQSEM